MAIGRVDRTGRTQRHPLHVARPVRPDCRGNHYARPRETARVVRQRDREQARDRNSPPTGHPPASLPTSPGTAPLLSVLKIVYSYAEEIEHELKRIASHSTGSTPMMCVKEKRLAKAVTELYESIHPIVIGGPEVTGGLPTRIRRALQKLDRQNLAWLDRWKWQGVIGAEGEFYIRSRLDRHTVERHIPFLRVILTLQSRDDAPDDPNADDLHDGSPATRTDSR